jgi:hypothetical protein
MKNVNLLSFVSILLIAVSANAATELIINIKLNKKLYYQVFDAVYDIAEQEYEEHANLLEFEQLETYEVQRGKDFAMCDDSTCMISFSQNPTKGASRGSLAGELFLARKRHYGQPVILASEDVAAKLNSDGVMIFGESDNPPYIACTDRFSSDMNTQYSCLIVE